MLENTNIKQFYPGPILNKTLDITDFLFKDPEQVHITYTYKNEDGSLNNRELAYGTEYEVAKILPSDVTQADAALTASTGRVTLKTDINIALGEKLTIYRESEIIQETQYPRTGPFPAASHEGALDYLTMQNQEQQDQIDRALKVPISTANFDGALPIPVPTRALKINNNGSGFEFSEYDPDTALETTKEYMESAQTAASSALASQNAAASSASSAANSEIAATQQANIATAKTAEVTETYNNAMADITTNKEQSMSAINENRISSIEEISNIKITAISDITTAGAEQVANIKQTGFYMQDGKLYYVDANGETKEFKTGGTGLELCDIGMALYIDETKGLRRYLNGQIVDINANTQAFLNRLKEITTLYPSLLCTEEEWQTAKTMSAFGQVGKFVFNYADDGVTVVSVRIPRVVNIQGVFDLQNLGLTVAESLPNIKGSLTRSGAGEVMHSMVIASGAFSLKETSNSAVSYTGSGGNSNLYFEASRSSSTYQDNAPVQQEAIQYPYFIQIATGSETENNIVNEIELNNPYGLFDSKYSDHELNNISWLKSEGQWNSKAVYPTVYDKLLKVYNGTETVEGLSVKLSTEAYTDYDFVLNTTDETFRLPLLDGSEDLLSDRYIDLELLASGSTYTAPANGWVLANAHTNSAGQYNSLLNITTAMEMISPPSNANISFNCIVYIPVKKNDIFQYNYSQHLIDAYSKFRFIYAEGNGSLYYYVGETVQNANLIDAGRIGEALVDKLDTPPRYVVEVSDKSLMPSWYVVYSDGWCEQGGFLEISSNSAIVTFLKPFINLFYTQQITCGWSSQARGQNEGVANRTTSSMTITVSTAGVLTWWQASGYIR